ncbi:MAG: TonB-dependent receptor [Proteobacteria bacterium]|nr:TonB-dependent receptor [Pseudomonadota bacterium]MBU4471764.1 TonB-dependent receptor [Pseudomonadota bacterium]MCG2750545.1 TonB-dependent receptor [Desulfobacteraceae bacterium]
MIKIPRAPLTGIILFISAGLNSFAWGATPEKEEWEVLNLFYKPHELVVSATHYPKPLSQVAENISIVTAEDIKAMNAHSVAEVLNRIPGVFLGGYDRNFGSTAIIQIQGSDKYHTLVLLDGIPWNYLVEGNAVTINIPVEIIERIEIIKGPASSSWGSSLGGVVNILTKTFSGDNDPSNHAYASYGENQTSDIRADFVNKLGRVDIFAYAGRMDSNGLLDKKSFENNSVYSKVRIPMNDLLTFGISTGYSEPDMFYGNFYDYDFSSSADLKSYFTTAYMDARLRDNLNVNLSAYSFQNRYAQRDKTLTGDYWGLSPDTVIQAFSLRDNKWGTKGKVVGEYGNHTALLGGDLAYGKLRDNTYFAPEFGGGYSIKTDVNTWAIYFNDTITMNQWAITPGIRYDSNSTSKDFVSPSLGMTFQPNHRVIFRAMASRGFSSPPLVYSSSYVVDLIPNPDLEPETINSYQLGIEAGISLKSRLKISLFHHDVENMFFKEYVDSKEKYRYINSKSATRQGFEGELQASLSSHILLDFGGTYVHQSSEAQEHRNQSSFNCAIAYQHPEIINARFMGQYMGWGQDKNDPSNPGSYDDVICDVHISKPVSFFRWSETELFITGRNIFNGDLYTDYAFKNPKRWFEAGVAITF